jgi:hypothetical protein
MITVILICLIIPLTMLAAGLLLLIGALADHP